MKRVLVLFAVAIALTSGACAKKESTLFEDNGKKMDQGIHNAGENVDKSLNKTGEKVKNVTH